MILNGAMLREISGREHTLQEKVLRKIYASILLIIVTALDDEINR